MDLKAHKELIRKQWAAQARSLAAKIKNRPEEPVMPMVELASPKRSDRQLDVASGWGFVALAFAPRVDRIMGIDLTPEMVELARRLAEERGFRNIEYAVGEAEDLRFAAGSFDLATCRLTFHHFGDPEKALFEMKRVLVPGGRLVLYDYLASSDEKKARRHNEIEAARDPAHVRMYALKEFQAFFRKCGLEERGKVTAYMKRDFDEWMDAIGAPEDRRKKTRKLLEESVEGNKAGLGPRLRSGKIGFSHTCVAWLLVPK